MTVARIMGEPFSFFPLMCTRCQECSNYYHLQLPDTTVQRQQWTMANITFRFSDKQLFSRNSPRTLDKTGHRRSLQQYDRRICGTPSTIAISSQFYGSLLAWSARFLRNGANDSTEIPAIWKANKLHLFIVCALRVFSLTFSSFHLSMWMNVRQGK